MFGQQTRAGNSLINLSIEIGNVNEDIDTDGIEDRADLDMDGDGLSNLDELKFNSDPKDASDPLGEKVKLLPSLSFQLRENSPRGTILGKLEGTEYFLNGQAEFSIDYLQPKIWLDADDNYTILSKNEKVSEWLDKSGSSYHLSQSNEAQKPFTNSGKINGKNVISFIRKDQHKLGRVTPENANWQDLFIVSQWTGTEDKFPGWAGLVTASSLSGDGLGVGILGHHQQKHIYKNTANGWFDHFYLNGIYSDQRNVFEEMKQPFLASISSDSSISVKGLIVGVDRNYNTRGWEGYIGEIIAFDYKLSDYERSALVII